MKDDEFRAIVAAGPTVVMVENGHMLALLDERDRLAAALRGLLDDHVALVNCGDCGHWDPETEDVVIAARAALAPTRTDGGDA